MRKWIAILSIVCLAVMPQCIRAALAQDQKENFIILVPYLTGESALGRSVSNLLRLQLSATFQEANTNTRGRMVWGEYQLSPSSHEEAVRRGLEIDAAAHLVLWGDAYQMADGVAIQAFLSVTPRLLNRRNRPEVWSVAVPDSNGQTIPLATELPRRIYQFPPILISDAAATEYQSLEGMPIFETPLFSKQIGTIGKLFRAFEYTENAVKLESNNTTGWVRLDFVREEENIIVEFSGALIRLCRGDLEGANQLLKAVRVRKSVPVDLLTDVHLLQGLIAELSGSSGLADFEKAVQLSPLDRVAASYLLMERVANVQRANAPEKKIAADALSRDLKTYERLFSKESQWLGLVRAFSSSQNP